MHKSYDIPEPTAPEVARQLALVQRLFVQHAARVRGFITALTPDLGMVDDVFQETYLTVTVKASSYDAERDFLPWACGIARFKVMEAGRRAAQAWKPLSNEVIEALCASEPEPDHDDVRLVHLEHCLGKLPAQARRLVTLFYHQSLKPAEITRMVGWTAESVYVALSRARAALRKCVEARTLTQADPS
jgi:RNA polymerase sigma-70 factor (ECF subfamily)